MRPKLLDAYTKNSSSITSKNADYAEVGEWADGNSDNEDRIGYFVSVDDTSAGKTMIKATSTSDVRGVTVSSSGFVSNSTGDMYNASGELLPKYSYVAFIGFAKIIDNGTCTVNEKCMPSSDGTAIPSTNDFGYQVIERIDDTHVLILVEPQGDAIQRIKDTLGSQGDSIQSMDNTLSNYFIETTVNITE